MCAWSMQIARHPWMKRYLDDLGNQPEAPRHIFPLQEILMLRREKEGDRIRPTQWGLVPAWAKEAKFGRNTYNARVETVAEKPSFKDAFKKRHGIIPVAAYFEWVEEKGKKTPLKVTRKDGGMIFVAALWEEHPTLKITSSTMITTVPSEALAKVHDRMPVLLEESQIRDWLDLKPLDIVTPYKGELSFELSQKP